MENNVKYWKHVIHTPVKIKVLVKVTIQPFLVNVNMDSQDKNVKHDQTKKQHQQQRHVSNPVLMIVVIMGHVIIMDVVHVIQIGKEMTAPNVIIASAIHANTTQSV
jgi:C4-dicarboxylate transporter